MASKVLSFLSLFLLATAAAAAAAPVQITGSRDITKVLSQFPNFSTLNKLLTQTKVADQINSRQTITVFVVADSAMSSVTSLPADVLQKVLSLHVVLDYFDIDKISNLHNTTALLTTLFQASGSAAGKSGFINATDVGDGQVKLGSAVDSSLTSDVIREIAMQPYNISVIEISQVIVPPGIASGSSNGSSSTAPATPAPKAAPATPTPKAAPATPEEAPASPKAVPAAPEEAPAAPKAAPVPAASSTSPSPSASSPSSKSNSSEDSPAPAAESPVSPPTQAPSTAPSAEAPADSAAAPAGPADAPADSADAPAGPVDAPVGPADVPMGSADAPAPEADKASSADRLVVSGAAVGAAFLAALL